MHPIIAHEAAKARHADWRQRAGRDPNKHTRHSVLSHLTNLARPCSHRPAGLPGRSSSSRPE